MRGLDALKLESPPNLIQKNLKQNTLLISILKVNENLNSEGLNQPPGVRETKLVRDEGRGSAARHGDPSKINSHLVRLYL